MESFPTDNNRSALTPQEQDAILARMQRVLAQMLMLATVSASNLDVDRATLQRMLEQLQVKLDQIADELS